MDMHEWHRAVAAYLNETLGQRRFWLWITIDEFPSDAPDVRAAVAPLAKPIDEWLSALGDPLDHQDGATEQPFAADALDVGVAAIGKSSFIGDDIVVGNPEAAFAYFLR